MEHIALDYGQLVVVIHSLFYVISAQCVSVQKVCSLTVLADVNLDHAAQESVGAGRWSAEMRDTTAPH